MSGGNNTTKKQLNKKINELMTMIQEMKENHFNEISLYRETFETQKQEMKKNYTNETSLYRELITTKDKEIMNLMSILEKHEKEMERIDEMRKKHEYEYNERLIKFINVKRKKEKEHINVKLIF
ncbi:10442_t:CDS:1 [Racocetra persica]|uniref:10442_t:CDS:1 n=1 Tax=Racocetra persica TaxID=160502 RepID=A0ACA9QYQ0_9GLOM|nr:10442_t:CDS:1 [Racocetra persica]